MHEHVDQDTTIYQPYTSRAAFLLSLEKIIADPSLGKENEAPVEVSHWLACWISSRILPEGPYQEMGICTLEKQILDNATLGVSCAGNRRNWIQSAERA